MEEKCFERLLDEYTELSNKIFKLKQFLSIADKVHAHPQEEGLMRVQLETMCLYRDILHERMRRIKPEC